MDNSNSAGPLKGHRVLVVEDNGFNQVLTSRILEHFGALVDVADNGIEALTRLRDTEYKLVLMDVMMPVMDGYQATRQIRGQLGLDVPIIAMTAGAFESDRNRCIAAGMNDFLAKPVQPKVLLEVIERLLAGNSARALSAPNLVPVSGHSDQFDPVQIAESLSGDLDLVAELAHEFVNNARLLEQDYKAVMTRGDSESLTRYLCTLKGMVSAFKFARLTRLAREAELASLAGESDCDDVIEQFFSELGSMLIQIDDWLSAGNRFAI